MDKKQIIDRFQELSVTEQRKITQTAIFHMAQEGHPVSRQAMQYWRKTEMSRSPIAWLYLEAYQEAFTFHNKTLTDV